MNTQSKKLEFILNYGTISKSEVLPTEKKFNFIFIANNYNTLHFLPISISQEVDSLTTFVNTVYNFIVVDLQD